MSVRRALAAGADGFLALLLPVGFWVVSYLKSRGVIYRQLVKGKSNRQAQTLVKRFVVRVVPKGSRDVDYAPKSRITEHLFPTIKREAGVALISARTRLFPSMRPTAQPTLYQSSY